MSCAEKQLDVTDPSVKGGPCDPIVDPAAANGPHCAEGFACDPVAGEADAWVCGEPLQIHGAVIDLQTGEPLAGALVHGLDRTGAPLGEVAETDATGRYELQVAAPRLPDGELASDASYTLQAFARDYLPFPSGIRVALPIHADEAEYDEARAAHVIEGPLTTVGLVMLPDALRGGVTVTGTVGGVQPGGTLVVAEGVSGEAVAQYGVADRSGDFTIFNVQAGEATIRGYRRGLELAAATASVATADLDAVALTASAEGEENLGAVSGSVQIVNAPGDSVTSVVLVPVSVFNPTLERGPVPLGLRAPDPGLDPAVTGDFTIAGVPAGTYKVLAAFENDRLVRDPDTSIGGTELQEVTVAAGQAVTVDAGFKITEALAVVAPGETAPTATSAAPVFEFADDSSEKSYLVRVFDVFGELVWEDAMVPSVSGSATVQVPYEGPALTSGLYYQFRAVSLDGKGVPLSATEDLRGVFVVE
ncbi:hypothetical protein POL25_26430 [Nannocystis sp. bb15-2]|uniref:Carboxypeptidase regulatory-like domain-containing protein n=1 Tax=Nannocystis bainbridge TaxID=2995303 RepID=A0ABT5E6N3_9BACT|nr:hypothetical protein [Nannocystis bainbridge]